MPDQHPDPLEPTHATARSDRPPRPTYRRWLGLLAAALGLCLVVDCVGGALALRQPSGPDPAADSQLSPARPDRTTPWEMALVDRAGTTVTVVIPQPRCEQIKPRAPHQVESAEDSVVISARTVTSDRTCQEFPIPLLASVELPSPLGSRRLVDGYDRAEREPLAEDRVPVPPADWTAYPVAVRPLTKQHHAWDFGYHQRGTNLHILVRPRPVSVPPKEPLGTAEVGGHEAVFHSRGGGAIPIATWHHDGMEFSVELVPAEGDSTDLAALQELLEQLVWS